MPKLCPLLSISARTAIPNCWGEQCQLWWFCQGPVPTYPSAPAPKSDWLPLEIHRFAHSPPDAVEPEKCDDDEPPMARLVLTGDTDELAVIAQAIATCSTLTRWSMEPGDEICKDNKGRPVIMGTGGWFQGIVCGINDSDNIGAIARILGEMEKLGITSLKRVRYDCEKSFEPGKFFVPLVLEAGVVGHDPIWGKLDFPRGYGGL